MKILTKTTTVRLPKPTHEEVIRLSTDLQRHPSSIMREAIIKHLHDLKPSKSKESSR